MDAKDVGQEHGATVRKAVDFAALLVVAVAKDVALNVQRGGGYLGGFAAGLVRGESSSPNA
jgi:hypothetical protein